MFKQKKAGLSAVLQRVCVVLKPWSYPSASSGYNTPTGHPCLMSCDLKSITRATTGPRCSSSVALVAQQSTVPLVNNSLTHLLESSLVLDVKLGHFAGRTLFGRGECKR